MFRPTVVIIRFYPKLYAKRRVFIQCAPHLWPKHVVFIYNKTSFIRHILVVLLTVVTPANSYYTQRGWHTHKKKMAILVCLLYKVLSAIGNFIGRAPHRGISQLVHSLKECNAVQSGKTLSKFGWLISHSFPRLNSESRGSPNVGSFLPDKTTSYQKSHLYKFPAALTPNKLFGLVNFLLYQKLSELYNFNL